MPPLNHDITHLSDSNDPDIDAGGSCAVAGSKHSIQKATEALH